MDVDAIRACLRIKSVIDQLQEIDQGILTPTEHEAWQNMLAQAYDRAAYFLRKTQYVAFRKEANNYYG